MRSDDDKLLQHVQLTVTALIQAVAFTELLVKPTPSLFEWPTTLAFDTCLRFLQGLFMFQLIALVWHELLTVQLGYGLQPRVAFGIRDSLFAFALGTTEVELVHTLEDPGKWFSWLAVFFAVSFLAYLNMYQKIERERAAFPAQLGRHFALFRRINLTAGPVLCAACLVLARWLPPTTPPSRGKIFLALNVAWFLVGAGRVTLMWDDVNPGRHPGVLRSWYQKRQRRRQEKRKRHDAPAARASTDATTSA